MGIFFLIFEAFPTFERRWAIMTNKSTSLRGSNGAQRANFPLYVVALHLLKWARCTGLLALLPSHDISSALNSKDGKRGKLKREREETAFRLHFIPILFAIPTFGVRERSPNRKVSIKFYSSRQQQTICSNKPICFKHFSAYVRSCDCLSFLFMTQTPTPGPTRRKTYGLRSF